MLFAQLVSEIDISRYKQKEYVNIVKAIYWEIFGKKSMKKKKYWETKAFKKKQNDMIKRLKKELRKYGYLVRVAN